MKYPPGTARSLLYLIGLLLLGLWAAPAIADSLEPAGEPFTVTYYFPSVQYEPKAPALHGFDRCRHPTREQMQIWWLDSPYSVINLYIGGAMYPESCQDPAIDAAWVRDVAAQGWSFTAVWVGPQAPCSNFITRMKSTPAEAYAQGISQAGKAAAAAVALGLPDDATLYYDVEGYPNDSACRATVASFLEGWTQKLHDLGRQAGAYGSPCRSYIADWATNDPAPDQVWIAHWQHDTYEPLASVWDVPCGVANTLWRDDQRIKQYAGDHSETYGGTTLGIDSNVFDTQPITLTTTNSQTAGYIHDFQAIGDHTGWIISGEKLYMTEDLGRSWTDRTPAGLIPITARFLDTERGWIFGRSASGTEIGSTTDGGWTWTFTSLDRVGDIGELPIHSAWIEVVDQDTLWISLKIASGSAFSIGRLLASTDGGSTWEARSIPIGAAVHFNDSAQGWTTGGPAGNETYRTADGGRSWQPDDSSTVRPGAYFPDLPENALEISRSAGDPAWVLIQQGRCSGPKGYQTCSQEQQLLFSPDGGTGWEKLDTP